MKTSRLKKKKKQQNVAITVGYKPHWWRQRDPKYWPPSYPVFWLEQKTLEDAQLKSISMWLTSEGDTSYGQEFPQGRRWRLAFIAWFTKNILTCLFFPKSVYSTTSMFLLPKPQKWSITLSSNHMLMTITVSRFEKVLCMLGTRLNSFVYMTLPDT